MVKRKVDNRVRTLIENGVNLGYRTLFVVVGDKSKDQVVYLHHMLSKTSLKQASVLWCYKKNLALSSNRKKRMKQLKAKQKYGNTDVNEDDPFEMFVSMTDIRYCYYKDTHKILGNTFKMCVIQDFEALTPNILCRTVETIEGGGVIVILLESMTSLKQLYTLNMDVHSRFRTEAHKLIVPRFNERFILSLASCPTCIVLNDELKILPISSLTKEIEAVTSLSSPELSVKESELKFLKESNKGVEPLGTLVGLCKTCDQAKVVIEFVNSITQKTLNSTLTLTAARGRGKSVAMGLALAGAIHVGYSNMFVTSPSPENLKALFEFLLKGLDALQYEKHTHYNTLISSDPEHNKAVMRLTVTKDHRQIVQYISPTESDALDHAELVVIDEAAAIPLPHVQALLGPYLVFLSSTISGYEGTGRSLSLKLIKQLREESKASARSSEANDAKRTVSKRNLIELSLKESIRYKEGDPVEKWLYDLLCLESIPPSLKEPLPPPSDCDLYYVNRDTLFGYHKMSEKFLKSVISLLVSSHYRNTPDDLQTLSDAPAHHLFVLLPPTITDGGLPNVYCVVQVALEGKVSKASLDALANTTRRPPGDMIPWTVSNLFQDDDFPKLSGVRIVRIATHPDLQARGYGTRALELLERYYNTTSWKASTEDLNLPEHCPMVEAVDDEELGLLDEVIVPRKQAHPLLLSLSEREAEPLHYMGVSFGASPALLRFWKKVGFTCVYLSQPKNSLTGEHTCLLLKVLNEEKSVRKRSWLRSLWLDYKKRMLNLLPGPFRHLETSFALSFIVNRIYKKEPEMPPFDYLQLLLKPDSLKRLDACARHQCDLSLIADILPRLALLYFLDQFPKLKLKALSTTLLLGVGILRKQSQELAKELQIENSVVMDHLHSLVLQLNEHFRDLWSSCEKDRNIGASKDLGQIAEEVNAELTAEMSKTKLGEEDVIEKLDMTQYVIKGKEADVQAPKAQKNKRIQMSEESESDFKKKKK